MQNRSAIDEAPTSPAADIPLSRRFGRSWRVGLVASAALVLVLLQQIGSIVLVGVGTWGTNIPFVWGFDLINYVWWIGIANGASLFAAILVIRRHSLRTAVNRFAEALALAAVLCAAVYPIFHLGRPLLFYWVLPYPASFQVWPQFRSPLSWDLWAILTHLVVTALFWYIGLIPDLATLRDRAQRFGRRRVLGLLALGWRGSARHWAHHQSAYRTVAALLLPMLLLLQTIVALEFVISLVPGWHQVRLPFHLVVTGLLSGIAIVLVIALLLRSALELETYITTEHIDLLTLILRATAAATVVVYLHELALGLLADPYVRAGVTSRVMGDYGPLFWGALILTALLPQLLWIPRLANSVAALLLVGIGVNVGVWLDRYSIVIGGISAPYLPSAWREYLPTLQEWLLFLGTLGLFAIALLLFTRHVPAIAIYEARHAEHRE